MLKHIRIGAAAGACSGALLCSFHTSLAVSILLGALWMSRWFLPSCAAALFYIHDWKFALLICVAWLLAMWAYRHFNLARFFEPPPSLL
jgi:hypothetical protein